MCERIFHPPLRLHPALLLLGCLALAAPVSAAAQVSDPTRPPGAEALAAWRGQPNAASTEWRLQSVLISGQRRIAVINGERAGVGQKINGALVRAIEPTHAIIETDTETLKLSIRRYGIDGREPE